MSEPYYNEGVGHGGFVATFTVAGSVVVESFNPSQSSSHIIQQSNQIGAPLKWAGVSGFATASATVQLPVANGAAVLIALGDDFTAPSSHGGGSWVVTERSEAFAVGDYWKSNLTLNKKYA